VDGSRFTRTNWKYWLSFCGAGVMIGGVVEILLLLEGWLHHRSTPLTLYFLRKNDHALVRFLEGYFHSGYIRSREFPFGNLNSSPFRRFRLLFPSPPSHKMGVKINSAVAAVVFLIGCYVQRQRRQNLKAREQGCQPVRSCRSFEPLSYSVNKDFHQYADSTTDMERHCRYHLYSL
jgi:hypothetical protein